MIYDLHIAQGTLSKTPEKSVSATENRDTTYLDQCLDSLLDIHGVGQET